MTRFGKLKSQNSILKYIDLKEMDRGRKMCLIAYTNPLAMNEDFASCLFKGKNHSRIPLALCKRSLLLDTRFQMECRNAVESEDIIFPGRY